MNITEKAMLVRLSISQWTARRFDRKATNEVIEKYQADKDAGRFNKMLVDLDSVKNYQRAANEARTFHYENTLPWLDNDSRILPSANYLDYSKKMRDLKSAFEKAVQDFISEYPKLIEKAERDLNGLFNPADYPESYQLEDKFNFSVHVVPVPDKNDFRVSLTDDDVDKIKANIEKSVQASISAAVRDCWDRLYKVVKHMGEKLNDPKAVFRDSLVKNISDLCDLLPKLNLTSDPGLDRMSKEIGAVLGTLDPESLRRYELERKLAADRAGDILKKMSSYVGDDVKV